MADLRRLAVKEQVLSCKNCELWKVGSGPVPFSGPSDARVAVIAEAPGRQEDKLGEPLVGPAGQLLRKNMTEAGLCFEDMFKFNTVSCWPDGTPKPEHINACCDNKETQLELANPEWVLVLGNVALSTLRSDLKISRARAHIFLHNERLWFPTFHPSAALRHRGTEQKLLEDLCLLRSLLEMVDPIGHGSIDCVVCGVDVDDVADHDMSIRFDDMMASYCNACWSKRDLS